MRVLLTGGTGFIGSAVLDRLLEAGHEVIAAVRSAESAGAVQRAGAQPVVGDLDDTPWLTTQLAGVDAAIHAAAIGRGDDAVLDAVIAAFSGTDRRYVHTGGIWTWGANSAITEDSPHNPPAIAEWREEREARLLAADVRASIIAPGLVYGHGRGIPFDAIAAAPRTDDGALPLVGAGDQHWPTVHVDDLAELYLTVLEHAPGGQVYLGASGENPTVRELAEAVVGPSGAVASQTLEQTHERFGERYADALLLDQQATAPRSRDLGWTPSRASVVDELAALGAAANA